MKTHDGSCIRMHRVICQEAITILMVFALWGCNAADDNRDEIVLHVTVQGLSADVANLALTATFDGTPATNDQIIQMPLDRFQVFLPKSSEGSLTLSATALAIDQCKVGTGQAVITVHSVSPYVFQAALQIVPDSTKSCKLTVNRTGDLYVSSNPPGIDCGNGRSICQSYFPVDTPVQLAAVLGPTAYGVTCVFRPS